MAMYNLEHLRKWEGECTTFRKEAWINLFPIIEKWIIREKYNKIYSLDVNWIEEKNTKTKWGFFTPVSFAIDKISKFLSFFPKNS